VGRLALGPEAVGDAGEQTGEAVGIGHRDREAGVAHAAGGIDADDRSGEADAHAAVGVGGEGEAVIDEREPGTAGDLEARVRTADLDGADVGQRGGHHPRAEPGGEAVGADLDAGPVGVDPERGEHGPEEGIEAEPEGHRRLVAHPRLRGGIAAFRPAGAVDRERARAGCGGGEGEGRVDHEEVPRGWRGRAPPGRSPC
jgi:hypothetical protein